MSDAPLSQFGELLRRYREAAGLTQEELAQAAGLTAKGVGALERAAMWRRHGKVLGRRLQLWRQASPAAAAACLLRHAALRDYGSVDGGGLGPAAFARDLWRVSQLSGRHPPLPARAHVGPRRLDP